MKSFRKVYQFQDDEIRNALSFIESELNQAHAIIEHSKGLMLSSVNSDFYFDRCAKYKNAVLFESFLEELNTCLDRHRDDSYRQKHKDSLVYAPYWFGHEFHVDQPLFLAVVVSKLSNCMKSLLDGPDRSTSMFRDAEAEAKRSLAKSKIAFLVALMEGCFDILMPRQYKDM